MIKNLPSAVVAIIQMKVILLSVYYFTLFVGDENHVETRLLANYVQIWSTLIGQIIFKLISDGECHLNVSFFCVDKFYVKSCFRT